MPTSNKVKSVFFRTFVFNSDPLMSVETEFLNVAFQLRPTNYQPNAITESRQVFTEMEKKIVVLVINQLRDIARSWVPGRNILLVIPYSELTEKHHDKIAAAAISLNSRFIEHHSFASPSDPEYNRITPFPRVRSLRIQNKRYIELTMLADIVPSFIELGKRYTAYSVEKMLSLSSTYAQRMYEIISMFYGRGQSTFTYKVSELRNALNYPSKHDYYDFKRKALEVAQKEMEKASLYFDFEPSKYKGKGVTELRFTVKSNMDLINEDVNADLKIARAMPPEQIVAIAGNLINDYQFTKKQQNDILQNLSLMDAFIKLHTEIYHGKREAKNPTAYIAKALGFGNPAPQKDPKPAPRSGDKTKKEAVPIGGVVADVLKKKKL